MGGSGRSIHRAHSKPHPEDSQTVRGENIQSQRGGVSDSLCEGKPQ